MADPTIFSYGLRDANKVHTSTRAYAIYNGAVETVDALIGNWTQLGGLIDAASGAQIIGGGVNIPLKPNAAWKDAPLAVNDVSDVIGLSFSNTFNSKKWTFILPQPLAAQLDADGKVVLTEANLDALVTLLVTSFTNGSYSDDNGQDLDALEYGFQSDRKHRKQIIPFSKAYPAAE